MSHDATILQKMDYSPFGTVFLQLGKTLNLRTITCERMLVHQAAANYMYYLEAEVPETASEDVILGLRGHICNLNSDILNRSNTRKSVHERAAG